MQEGLLSLMQMAKTNASLTRLAKKGLPYISVLTDPTMGGVSAGFAFVGDVVIAEPKALIGFAGPRVIESTVRVKLPEGFQRSEFLQTKGAIDLISDRRELRKTIANTLAMLQRRSQRPHAGTTRRKGNTSQSVKANTKRPSGLPERADIGIRWYCMYRRSTQAPPTTPLATSSSREMIWYNIKLWVRPCDAKLGPHGLARS
jgi:hypothetical protein